ncbi:unnamed protein product [Prorocentrum cordatum]|uniref:Uncharacterized protein n=1 Tax=Prorocentrum cordatum TaxID=2364126 RepID=A0ABN9RSV4_9DINO|nr:unnamed protein product [Polarella glacialis]
MISDAMPAPRSGTKLLRWDHILPQETDASTADGDARLLPRVPHLSEQRRCPCRCPPSSHAAGHQRRKLRPPCSDCASGHCPTCSHALLPPLWPSSFAEHSPMSPSNDSASDLCTALSHAQATALPREVVLGSRFSSRASLRSAVAPCLRSPFSLALVLAPQLITPRFRLAS